MVLRNDLGLKGLFGFVGLVGLVEWVVGDEDHEKISRFRRTSFHPAGWIACGFARFPASPRVGYQVRQTGERRGQARY